MQRRAVVRSALTVIGWLPLGNIRAWAQSTAFPGSHEHALKELAATVLPSSLGRSGTDEVSLLFVRWVRQYRPGAELQTGYGFTRIRFQPPSPAEKYMTQLGQLGTDVFPEKGLTARRSKIAARLNGLKIKDLTSIPEGNDVVADLMSFYFGSSAANDLAYGAAIGRDKCRTLDNSGEVPVPLKGSNSANI
jgi:hypothetical protein